MSKFLSTLDVRQVPFTDDEWVLINPLVYQSDILGSTITVPATFQTDYASTPQAMWWLMPKSGKYDAAAVVHDYLYTFKKLDSKILTQKNCDDTFLEAMAILGVGWLQRSTMWAALRIFGVIAWNKKPQQEPEQ